MRGFDFPANSLTEWPPARFIMMICDDEIHFLNLVITLVAGNEQWPSSSLNLDFPSRRHHRFVQHVFEGEEESGRQNGLADFGCDTCTILAR
jgi:hypothetical protein